MTDAEGKTYSEADYNKAVEKAQRLEAQVVDLGKKLEAWGDLDPKAVKGIIEDHKLMKKEKATTSPEDLDAWKAEESERIKKEFSDALTKAESEREEFKTRAHKAEVMQPALMEAAKHFTPNGIKLLTSRLESSLKMVDGKIVAVDEKGAPITSKRDPRAGAMEIGEYFEDLAAGLPEIAVNKGKSGTMGATGKATTEGKSYTISQIRGMPSAEQQKVFKELGPEKVSALFTGDQK